MSKRCCWARIYEVFPLLCPQCGGEVRIITFITEAVVIREIPGHLGESSLWETLGAEPNESDPQGNRHRTTKLDQRVT